MTKLTAHFDGKVIVPDEPVDLPLHERLVIHVERAEARPALPQGSTLAAMLEAARQVNFDKESIRESRRQSKRTASGWTQMNGNLLLNTNILSAMLDADPAVMSRDVTRDAHFCVVAGRQTIAC